MVEGTVQYLSLMLDGYLIELEGREHEAVERLISLPVISEGFLSSLGLASKFSWYLLRIRTERLVASMLGDVDLLAGRLEWTSPEQFQAMVATIAEETLAHPDVHPSWHQWFAALKLAAAGGIRWPPSVDHLVAVEAKCAYLPADALEISERTLRSKKQSQAKARHARRQVDQLLAMGFDRVALLDIIANPPGQGHDGQAWLAGSTIASRTLDAMTPVLERRLPIRSPAGHYVWSAASVGGADERWRGGGTIIERRPATNNPLLPGDATVRARREEMETSLARILGDTAHAVGFPVILVDCPRCGTIHGVARSC
jgi:hypothetical protein